jgi:hypothetical protein
MQAALLSIPSGAVAMIAIGGASYTSFRWSNRSAVIVSLLIPGMIGAGLMAFLPGHAKIGRLMGTYLTNTIPACELATGSLIGWLLTVFPSDADSILLGRCQLCRSHEESHSKCSASHVSDKSRS